MTGSRLDITHRGWGVAFFLGVVLGLSSAGREAGRYLSRACQSRACPSQLAHRREQGFPSKRGRQSQALLSESIEIFIISFENKNGSGRINPRMQQPRQRHAARLIVEVRGKMVGAPPAAASTRVHGRSAEVEPSLVARRACVRSLTSIDRDLASMHIGLSLSTTTDPEPSIHASIAPLHQDTTGSPDSPSRSAACNATAPRGDGMARDTTTS